MKLFNNMYTIYYTLYTIHYILYSNHSSRVKSIYRLAITVFIYREMTSCVFLYPGGHHNGANQDPYTYMYIQGDGGSGCSFSRSVYSLFASMVIFMVYICE